MRVPLYMLGTRSGSPEPLTLIDVLSLRTCVWGTVDPKPSDSRVLPTNRRPTIKGASENRGAVAIYRFTPLYGLAAVLERFPFP